MTRARLMILAILPVALLYAAPGCSKDESKDLQVVSKADRDRLRDDINQTLREIDNRLDELRAGLADATGESKAEIEAHIKSLNQSREELATKLDRLDNIGTDEWEKFKGDAQDGLRRARDVLRT